MNGIYFFAQKYLASEINIEHFLKNEFCDCDIFTFKIFCQAPREVQVFSWGSPEVFRYLLKLRI